MGEITLGKLPMLTYTAFHHHDLLATGPLEKVALACRAADQAGQHGVLLFSDDTGRQVDLDLSGSEAEVLARLPAWQARYETPAQPQAETSDAPRGRGRPALGVVAREVTLLPRHWDWLAQQPGGASVTLRKLVENARRVPNPMAERKRQQERVYRVLTALAGDLLNYEEAIRALFANDRPRFAELTAGWPKDIRSYASGLWEHKS
jgi:hypothetical protein